MDTETYIIESIMSLLFTLSTFPVDSEDPSQSVQVSCLKFDEFLAKNIHSHLVDFPRTKTFRFQTYLLRMFLYFNEENLQLLEMVITEEINNDYTKFMNFFMTGVYGSFFQKQVHRVLPEMKDTLQSSLDKRIGYWFLSEQGIVIRLYGFVHKP